MVYARHDPDAEVPVYREIFVPVDNSPHSDWAVDRAIELCRRSEIGRAHV